MNMNDYNRLRDHVGMPEADRIVEDADRDQTTAAVLELAGMCHAIGHGATPEHMHAALLACEDRFRELTGDDLHTTGAIARTAIALVAALGRCAECPSE